MKYKIKTIIASLIIILGTAAMSGNAFALTKAQEAVCGGAGLVSTSGSCAGDADTPKVDNILAAVVNILSIIVGIAAVIMVVIGGFKYVTSKGDSNAVGSAKSTILYAFIGLIIAALAQVLVHLVLTRLTTDTPPATGTTLPRRP